MMINYNKKVFVPVRNSANGETSSDTKFYYSQAGNILTARYQGGKIVDGHLMGLVDQNGGIDIRYHQVNTEGTLMTGICRSVPEILPNGKIRLHENWQWTSGDLSSGRSMIDEL
ncbi:MAG: n-acetylglutamate synthase [Sphingobacterium sp.]